MRYYHVIAANALAILVCFAMPVQSALAPAETIASLYSLTTSTTLAFPSQTLSSDLSDSHITSNWGLSKGRITDGGSNLAFVNDPFPDSPVPNSVSPPGPVLQATYPAGSFNNNTGGAQFESLWNTTDGSVFQTMLLSYEVAFDDGFNWVKGGKLPGLRGGPNSKGCSGGNQPNGTDCFSTRLMWRTNGAGEVYGYFPSSDSLCSQSTITCNNDFGISIDRGAFSFASGRWNRVSLLVRLNNPPSASNGAVELYYNDIQAITQDNLQFRTSSVVDVNGLYFSTFFGGGDSSWATPVNTHTYFRNLQLWGSSTPSNLTQTSSASPSDRHSRSTEWGWVICIAAVMFVCGVGVI